LQLPKTIAANKPVTVTVTVKNTGKRDGDEVVQLYVSHQTKSKAPVRALKGFKRIALKAGESKTISFKLTPEELSLVNETTGKYYQPKGNVQISVGGGQPGVKNKTTSNVLSSTMQVL
jgi:beta-glucosidase